MLILGTPGITSGLDSIIWLFIWFGAGLGIIIYYVIKYWRKRRRISEITEDATKSKSD